MSDEPATVPPCCAATLFDIVWDTMADVIGTAATATLVRRSARRVADRGPDLEGLTVIRDGFEYTYKLPDHWREARPEPVVALRKLARELSPLLAELMGPVVIRRLGAVSDLTRCQILFEERP